MTRELEEQNSSIEVGREYVVLEVLASPGRYVHLRLDLAPGVPSLWDAEMFETVDPGVPPNWVATIRDGGFLALGPARWRDGFWERYFDDDPEAIVTFEAERTAIVGESRGLES
ncbi:hypothetical protein [Kribbella albertanoniae]|uniref:Uncharacterized protein n=1 Tax=Kribbella albertanoniae TaxID=1266829 RepID=A0A4R4NYN1_9ACTN|nr:hypothetical protein [Kribbella albertanoniae]TDC14649.1 hypothetical protein E1261_41895 [Kribbella albertanoniae]